MYGSSSGDAEMVYLLVSGCIFHTLEGESTTCFASVLLRGIGGSVWSNPYLKWDVTEKVWLRAMYSDGIAAQTRKTEGDLKTEG